MRKSAVIAANHIFHIIRLIFGDEIADQFTKTTI